jgi:hypothetical protein
VQTPPHVCRIVARQRGAHDVRRGERLSCEEQALYRGLPISERSFEPLALLGDARSFGAQLPRFADQLGERAIGFRNGALRLAQAIARFALLGFLGLYLFLEGLDSLAQALQIARRRLCGECRGGDGERKRADQTLALPCAETAAMRLATSLASPR